MQVEQLIRRYRDKLNNVLQSDAPFVAVQQLVAALSQARASDNQVFLCGNGGSAGNAIHLANDYLYGAGGRHGKGLKVEALSANSAVLTCLANDVGYDSIYSEQLKVKGHANDILIVLSGSGNSPNIVKALEYGNQLSMQTFAILGYSGGQCKQIAQVPIHFEVNDMQIAEDLQLIVGHICMQYLCNE